MRESISTSKRALAQYGVATAVALGGMLLLLPSPAHAADSTSGGTGFPHSRTNEPEEEDFVNTPYTNYGEFNEDKEEEEQSIFLQNGRFFGVSVGVGFEAVDGNRGLLWQGGFPTVEFKLLYWFDFNFALDLGGYTASQYYVTSTQNGGQVNVNMTHVGVDLRYYFDTKDLSAPISFASPFLMLGGGSFTKSESSVTNQTSTSDTSIGLTLGGGLEFTLKPRSIYLDVEGTINVVTFQDTYTTLFQPAIPNLTGNLYTMTANVLFTW